MANPPLFPDRPFAWLVRGTYRTLHMRKHTCSACVYTARNSPAQAEKAAQEGPGRWMRIRSIAPTGNPA